ncbi:MAG: GIY-YIG nuclease family protein [Dolichospermum sp.]|jgi:hypothetical protein
MNNTDLGYIYILENPGLKDNLLKIGYTKRTPELRAKELSTTGVPDQFKVVYKEDVPNYKIAEKIIHNNLKDYHYNKEFFQLPIQEAISKIQSVTQREIYTTITEKDVMIFNGSMTLKWFCYPGDFIFIVRYKTFIDSLEMTPSIIDILKCKEGDQILISNRPGKEVYLSDDEFISLDIDQSINGSLHHIFNIFAGDKIAWLGRPRERCKQSEEYSIICILDCHDNGHFAGFSAPSTVRLIDGLPLPFGGLPLPFGYIDSLENQPSELMRQAFMKIKRLGIPRNWSPER